MQRGAIIIQAINSGYEIDAKLLRNISDTISLHWYTKILIHGAEVIKHALMPIGEFLEEAAESEKKDLKQLRWQLTKMSSTDTYTDILSKLF